MAAGALGNPVGILRLGSGGAGRLAGRIRRSLRLQDARLRPCVDVLDVGGVFGIHLIKLGKPVVDGIGLPANPHFARERIHMSPEPLFRGGNIWRCFGVGLLLCCWGRGAL